MTITTIDNLVSSIGMSGTRFVPELRGEQHDLLIETIRVCFWYKKPLIALLIRCGIPRAYAHRMQEFPSKTAFMRSLVEEFGETPEGRERLHAIATEVSRIRYFTALENDAQFDAAREAVAVLRDALNETDVSPISEIDTQAAINNQVPEAKHAALRSSLGPRLTEMFTRIGSQQAGFDFEGLVCDLAESEDLETRRPYRIGNTRQYDGAVSVNGIVYLLESKFEVSQAASGDVYKFVAKVQRHADLTQGLFIAMSGYSEGAVDAASTSGSPVVLLDGEHITNCVFGGISFERVITLAKRHASETGEALMRWPDMRIRLGG